MPGVIAYNTVGICPNCRQLILLGPIDEEQITRALTIHLEHGCQPC